MKRPSKREQRMSVRTYFETDPGLVCVPRQGSRAGDFPPLRLSVVSSLGQLITHVHRSTVAM